MIDEDLLNQYLRGVPVDDLKLKNTVYHLFNSFLAYRDTLRSNVNNKNKYTGKMVTDLKQQVLCQCGEVFVVEESVKLQWPAIDSILNILRNNVVEQAKSSYFPE